ncbi:MAG: hypothetical protein LUE17_16600, partial [Planctomycetaceae bacterium]|nr:hypothetical protein [Planctomycetaceae bacterium]
MSRTGSIILRMFVAMVIVSAFPAAALGGTFYDQHPAKPVPPAPTRLGQLTDASQITGPTITPITAGTANTVGAIGSKTGVDAVDPNAARTGGTLIHDDGVATSGATGARILNGVYQTRNTSYHSNYPNPGGYYYWNAWTNAGAIPATVRVDSTGNFSGGGATFTQSNSSLLILGGATVTSNPLSMQVGSENRFEVAVGGTFNGILNIAGGHITVNGNAGNGAINSTGGNNYWSIGNGGTTGQLTGGGTRNEFTVTTTGSIAGINASGLSQNNFELRGTGSIGAISANGGSNQFNISSGTFISTITASGNSTSEFVIGGESFTGAVTANSTGTNAFYITGGTFNGGINAGTGAGTGNSTNQIRIAGIGVGSAINGAISAGGRNTHFDISGSTLSGAAGITATGVATNQLRIYNSTLGGATSVGATNATNNFEINNSQLASSLTSTGVSNQMLVRSNSRFQSTVTLTGTGLSSSNILDTVQSIFDGAVLATGNRNDFRVVNGTFNSTITATGNGNNSTNRFLINSGTFNGDITASGQNNDFSITNGSFRNITANGTASATNRFLLANGSYNDITASGNTNLMQLGHGTGSVRNFNGTITANGTGTNSTNQIEVFDGLFAGLSSGNAIDAIGHDNQLLIHAGSFTRAVTMTGMDATSSNIIDIRSGTLSSDIIERGRYNTVVVENATVANITT